MRRIAPTLVVAILALVAGCADTTSPTNAITRSPAISALIGNPPPPPSDTGGSYSYSSSSGLGSFAFNAIYFVNPTEKAGFIHFNTDQPAGVTISPNASIDYHLGTITGAGTITALTDGGTVTIDLARVVAKGFFNPTCSGVIDERINTCASVSAPATLTDKSGAVTGSADGTFTIGLQHPPTTGD